METKMLLIQIATKSLICIAALVPLFYLVRRPTKALVPAQTHSYDFTIAPSDEGTIYVAE